MARPRDLLGTQRRPRAPAQRDQGTHRSVVYSETVWSDSSQQHGLKVLRKYQHNEEVNAYHNFEGVLTDESL